MIAGRDTEDRPLSNVAELYGSFARGKERHAWRLGAEHEKIGVYTATGGPVPYEGPRGIRAVLLALASELGHVPITEGEQVIALFREPERVTLEPGGQLELSGAPLATGKEIEAEITRHLDELRRVSEPLGITWLSLGFRPFGTIDDVAWVPKGRYAVMREYLPTRGRLGHEMMKRTATVQANLDYADEDDAERKLCAAMSVTSIVTALFANSPLAEGQDTGFASYRARAWLETDPDRCGLLPFAFERGGLFRKYAEWALDVPMFFVYRHAYLPAQGMTFRRFLREGFQGLRATMADWELHLSTLFPEVRLKHYLEMRGADSGPKAMVLALPALWKGLLYDDEACAQAERLTHRMTFAERIALREAVPRAGLSAPVGAQTVLELARELVGIARTGLLRVAPDEVPYLAPLDEIVATGRAPTEQVRDAWQAAAGNRAAFLRAVAY